MRAKRLRYAPAALADISEIHAHLRAETSLAVANRVVSGIRDDIRRRREMPLLGAPRSEFGDGCRMLISGSYVAYYSIADGEMIVLRILHQARDRDAIMRRGVQEGPAIFKAGP